MQRIHVGIRKRRARRCLDPVAKASLRSSSTRLRSRTANTPDPAEKTPSQSTPPNSRTPYSRIPHRSGGPRSRTQCGGCASGRDTSPRRRLNAFCFAFPSWTGVGGHRGFHPRCPFSMVGNAAGRTRPTTLRTANSAHKARACVTNAQAAYLATFSQSTSTPRPGASDRCTSAG